MATLKPLSRFSTFSGRLNLVPMIDIVFQLLVFFMVASHLATAGRETIIKIPQPTQSQAREKPLANQIIVNLVADTSGRIAKIKANSDLVRDLPALVDLLLRYGPKIQAGKGTLVLRADRTLQFAQMEKVLQAIGNAGITSIHIAAEENEKKTTGTTLR